MVRVSILAALGWLALVGANPAPDINAQGEQAGRNRIASEHRAPATAAALKQDVVPRQDTGCEPGQDERQSDLCAQWKAADAAYDAALSARAQTLIGYIGLGLGAITMLAAIAAALYAKRAAVATEETVEIARDASQGAQAALDIAERNAQAAAEQVNVSRDTAKRQLRAYLGLQPIQMNEITPLPSPNALEITIENYGPTPANDWRIIWSWVVTAQPASRELFESLVSRHRDFRGEHAFAPKTCKDMSFDVVIDDEHRRLVIEEKGRFYFLGEIVYRDVFGEEHKTEFFYVYNLTGPTRMGQMPVANRIA